MKKISNLIVIALFVAVIVLTTSCRPSSGNHTGTEYMPDMAHSIAVEANYNTYYSLNRDSDEKEYRDLIEPRKPVAGTVPRGYLGYVNAKSDEGRVAAMRSMADWVPDNGFVPYYYGSDDSSRTLASNDNSLDNPFPITQKGLATGKDLYDKFCGICHGSKGDGNGKLYDDGNGPYPLAPTSYLSDDMYNAKDGRFYHVIMKGKGAMGAYADKLSYEERYQVIHHIRSLQAKAQGTEYGPIVEVDYSMPEEDHAEGEHAHDENHGHGDEGHHEEEGHSDEHNEGDHGDGH